MMAIKLFQPHSARTGCAVTPQHRSAWRWSLLFGALLVSSVYGADEPRAAAEEPKAAMASEPAPVASRNDNAQVTGSDRSGAAGTSNSTDSKAGAERTATADSAAAAASEQDLFVAGWPAYREQLRRTALTAGIAPSTVDSVFADLQLVPRVVSQDRAQPHTALRHEDYLLKVINEQRINTAREKFREHADLLTKLEATYGVEGKFIIALWGVESSFGRITGKHHVPSALATMAYEGRRRDFFQKEFIASLRIIEQGHIDNDAMRGSWAGAMGQCQFMPSSFLNFAADGDGDGHKDIWNNTADVLASIANYLHKNGWRRGETWGRQVRVTQALSLTPEQLRQARALTEWQTLGVRRDTGADLPMRDLPAKLLLPDSEWERTYLVYHNYDVLLRWNRSRHFATSVGYLAERIGFPQIPSAAGPETEPVTATGAAAGDQAITEAP